MVGVVQITPLSWTVHFLASFRLKGLQISTTREEDRQVQPWKMTPDGFWNTLESSGNMADDHVEGLASL